MPGGKLQKSFKKVKSPDDVAKALMEFYGDRASAVTKQFLIRLKRLREAIEESKFFETHEVCCFCLCFVF